MPNVEVAFLTEKGNWIRQIIDKSFIEGHAICTADLNNDGRNEIIAGFRGKGGSVYIYTAEDGMGLRWTRHDLDKGGMCASSCVISDLDSDGKPDVVRIGTATANLKWYENR